ncbi:hypothetical protein GGX14DRAFT_582347 [Mycena pura]|uniref:Uncharacterized protein n=1 Tax=Mycena pura TaxID=153505 RepID=A0AAD6YV36_9AGAR|nr:hypothetical protein GGX14DRAFT_582347 [Mycena pura]
MDTVDTTTPLIDKGLSLGHDTVNITASYQVNVTTPWTPERRTGVVGGFGALGTIIALFVLCRRRRRKLLMVEDVRGVREEDKRGGDGDRRGAHAAVRGVVYGESAGCRRFTTCATAVDPSDSGPSVSGRPSHCIPAHPPHVLTVVRQMSRTPSPSYTPPVKRRSSVTDPPGGKPPRKCRRLSHTAQKFLDLEAYDAESEVDEDAADAELRDFLDDAPHVASRPHHSGRLLPLLPRSQTPTDEAQDTLDIANAIRARERQRLLEAIPPLSMHETTAAGSLVAARPAALIVPYIISIPPSVPLEQKLIRWLRGSVPGVVDVVSHRLGSGRIYVTAHHYACLQRGLDEWPLSWNLSQTQRKPKPLPPLEYQLAMERLHERHAVTETPPERRPGTWARFTIDVVNGDDFVTLAGDLLVLLGQGLALTVPRINYTAGPVAPVLVPPCLSFPMTLIQAHPHMKDEIVLNPPRQCWTWRKRCFRESGLEVFQVDESEITVDGVEPTDDERRLFALSGDPLLCRPSLEPVVDISTAALAQADFGFFRPN